MSVCFCSIFILIPLELRPNKNPITRAIMISIRSLLSNSTSYFWMNKFEWGHPVKHKASCCHILVQTLRTPLAYVLHELTALDRPAIQQSNSGVNPGRDYPYPLAFRQRFRSEE